MSVSGVALALCDLRVNSYYVFVFYDFVGGSGGIVGSGMVAEGVWTGSTSTPSMSSAAVGFIAIASAFVLGSMIILCSLGEMVEAAGCSKRSIITISNNLRMFGDVRAPLIPGGRPRPWLRLSVVGVGSYAVMN
ncbi:hypothetical protein PDE_07117 [Penicillium oxalicum 114-2]|uniref:Uncharacterized protein n=1 Tax=Penicillium oxalicum (strain 114-2 / CGMCC 5302) TaxID=933388 RepID=S8BBB3_PENO1|nr:hypothetical protein PDE_07117 [Penicillium oxalicum 114-2]